MLHPVMPDVDGGVACPPDVDGSVACPACWRGVAWPPDVDGGVACPPDVDGGVACPAYSFNYIGSFSEVILFGIVWNSTYQRSFIT